MGFAEVLFSAQGRAPRLPSLIATAALLMLAAFYEAATEIIETHCMAPMIDGKCATLVEKHRYLYGDVGRCECGEHALGPTMPMSE